MEIDKNYQIYQSLFLLLSTTQTKLKSKPPCQLNHHQLNHPALTSVRADKELWETHNYNNKLSSSVSFYYYNKFSDIYQLRAKNPVLVKAIKHYKQLLAKIAFSAPNSALINENQQMRTAKAIRKILLRFSESPNVVLDTSFITRAIGCSRVTARRYITLIAEIFKVKQIYPETVKRGRAKQYRISIFELVFSRQLYLRS